ncbi:serine hydrolase family protein [bacterium]|nr:serine hydrolase family protein [bacterium]
MLTHSFKKILYSSLLGVFFLNGCTHIPTLDERKTTALNLSFDKAVTQTELKTSTFNLFSMQKLSQCENKDMKVYIEGDGLSWITKRRISDNPTPLNPVGLSLMLSDKSNCKVYIARPCQYVKQSICENKYWTSHRFNTKIIQSFDEALSNLKKNHKNSSFTLIGYSGGAAVAALTAVKREDISRIITVAGNLETNKWTELHHISPLDGSLNPADYTKELQNIPQYHLIGNNDKIVPKEVFLSYFNKFENKNNVKYFTYDATHGCCWDAIYKDFLKGVKTDESTKNR